MTKSFNSFAILCFGCIEIIWCVMSSTAACPNECLCKWKSGKQTVECLDRGLITVPSGIEFDTQVLDLSGNDLQILRAYTFQKSSLINLQKLYLRLCRLGQINRNAFQGLQNVVEIDLSGNLLTYIPSQAFEDMPFLRNISLANNPIQKVETFAFRAVTQLLKLDLSQCQLQMIQPKAFDGLDSLDYLKLNDNQLRGMPIDTLQSLRQLRAIEVQGNPWKCDCHLRNLKEWMNRIDNRVPYMAFCYGGPERVKDKAIFELDIDYFACHPSIKADVTRIETTLGSNITLACRVESDPIATISWYKYVGNGRLLLNDSIFNKEQRFRIEKIEDGIHDFQSRLTLKIVEQHDVGEYRCVAENKAGVDEANITLLLVTAVGPLIYFGNGNINVIMVTLTFIIALMIMVIVLLIRRIRYSFHSNDKDDKRYSKKTTNVEKSWIETSSQKSHDSEIKSDLSKAFAVTSDLSYSYSPSDIGNSAFSNADCINGTNVRDSSRILLPVTRPIRNYCNRQQTYPMPKIASCNDLNYETTVTGPVSYDRMMQQTTNGAGRLIGSDDVFAHCRKFEDYPSDYGLPILLEEGVASQSSAKMLKIRQCGVPVLPPINDGSSPPLRLHSTVPPSPIPSYMQSHPVQMLPADEKYQRCGTDV